MFDTRLTAPRFQAFIAALLFTANCAALAAAQSAATSGDQWRAAGSANDTQSTNAQASTSADASNAAGTTGSATWQLPNSQSNNATASSANTANPLRPASKPQITAAPREPQAFKAPANAKPLNTSQSAAVSNKKYTTPQRSNSTSAAVAAKPAQVANQQYMLPRTLPQRAPAVPAVPQYQAAQRPAQPTGYAEPNRASNGNTGSDGLWQTINVAFNGQPPKTPSPASRTVIKKASPESLPMPSDFDASMQDPVMRQPSGPDAFRQPLGGPYYRPYCDQGQCCDGPGCPTCPNGCGNPCCGDDVFEPGCGAPCGSGCGQPCGEPGCACEPGCDCPNGNCKKDCLCIGPGDDESCHIVQIRWPKWQEVMVFGGPQGFKGPYDRDRDAGNFGFNEGFNVGAKLPYAQLGYQYGYRVTENQLNGDQATDTDHQYLQEFVTAGIFHRQKEGLQFGVVWDALIDERTKSENFHQIRTEVSVLGCCCHEFGFGATIGLNRKSFDDGNNGDLTFQASDQYVAFYRFHGCNGGEGRIYAGGNNDSDGIVGADMLLPVNDCFSVQSGFTYLIPHGKGGVEGASQEAWNIGIGLVWHWDHQARKCFDNCYRPLFNVADNGSLIVDQQKEN